MKPFGDYAQLLKTSCLVGACLGAAGSGMRLYVDGASVGSTGATGAAEAVGAAYIGRSADANLPRRGYHRNDEAGDSRSD